MRLRKGRVVIAVIILLLLLFNVCLSIFMIKTRKIDDKNIIVEVNIESGMSTSSILDLLDNKGLIRSKLMCKIYSKISSLNMQAGIYEFSTSMNSREILKSIANGKITTKYNINLTFKEGKNINWYAKEIEKNTNNKIDDVYDLLKDNDYIDELINNYWFLTDDIKSSDIYYPLEGYLFPETYTFNDKDVTVKEIFNTMLNQTNKILSKYKDEIESKNLNVHEFMTLASIVELEGKYDDDRATIAGVFYNRLKSGWSLGSDVTTYYAVQKDMGEYPEIWQAWLDFDSPYNTRLSSMAGKLPVGPIGNPGEASIKACISPVESNYYYFVADCTTNKTVFNETYEGHVASSNKIHESGCKF